VSAELERTAIVTGGGAGIGRGIAEALAGRGYRVAIIGRDRGRLQATTIALGPGAICRQVDVGDREQVEVAISEIIAEFGTIDVLVNNAGISRWVTTKATLLEAEDALNDCLRTNVKGALLVAIAVAGHLRRPGGRIVNLSSISAFIGGRAPGSLAYATSKAAINGLTYALARELSPEGITVNAVAPGLIEGTEFNRDYPEEFKQHIVQETPVGRRGEVADVVAAVMFFCSAEASFVTGEVLAVNGGRLFGR
jgi:NAD(P)-dependent dehydrogenase (short-subunit alcohol dehydrogenase family)